MGQGTFLVMVMVIMVVLAMVMMVTPDGKQRTLRSVIFMVIIPQTLLVVKLLCNVDVHFEQSNNLCTFLRRVGSRWSRCGKA